MSREGNNALADAVRDTARSYLGEAERSAAVIDALRSVDRADFLPAPYQDDAYADVPLPIGSGQTCSQSSMVALMLDLLAFFYSKRLKHLHQSLRAEQSHQVIFQRNVESRFSRISLTSGTAT